MATEQVLSNLAQRVASQMHPTWAHELSDLLEAPWFHELARWVAEERQRAMVYPPQGEVFTALKETPWDKVRVVIVGQDPYHGEHQAHGLSFSVLPGVKIPPSLKNIFLELEKDCGIPPASQGCLLPWAQEGVLLLNAVLTVRAGEPGSHAGRGWERFTDEIMKRLWDRPQPTAFLLWGKWAAQKLASVAHGEQHRQHLVLQAPHPSPLSAYTGFLGCRHFSRVNEWLDAQGAEPIHWDALQACAANEKS
ncbi:MAG: uracil-DNA glycosylase [Chlamydiia bacterium]